MDKRFKLILVVICFIIFFRYKLQEFDFLIYYIAAINIVSISYILFTILDRAENGIAERIRKNDAPMAIINRECKLIRRKISYPITVIYILLVIIYIKFFCSELLNDVITIIALGISILDDDIVLILCKKYKI